jgi:hypothetical protein
VLSLFVLFAISMHFTAPSKILFAPIVLHLG